MKSKTIEVNGRQYDAQTGAVLGVATAPPKQGGHNIDGFFRARPAAQSAPVEYAAPSIDGMRVLAPTHHAHHDVPETHHAHSGRGTNHHRAHAPQTAVRQSREAERVQASHHEVRHKPSHHTITVNHTKHHVAQSSKTLVRSGVQRPLPSFHKQAGTVSALQHEVPSLIEHKPAASNIDTARLVRAQQAHRSPKIAHHGTPYVAPQASLVELAVVPAPTPTNGDEPAVPAPTPGNGDEPTEKTTPSDIFEKALMKADNFVDIRAHTHHFKKQVRHHMASMAAGTLALVVIAGFAAYQNSPGLQFKVAGVQAGISTGMPNFKAAGFAYNGVRAGNGKLTVGFKDSRGTTYQLTQEATNLSGSDVISNVSATDASGTPNYVTMRAGNTTVYRFASTDATWVSDGTWYTVTGNGPLTNQQVSSLVQNI